MHQPPWSFRFCPGRHPVLKYRVPPSPHANSFIIGTSVIKTHTHCFSRYVDPSFPSVGVWAGAGRQSLCTRLPREPVRSGQDAIERASLSGHPWQKNTDRVPRWRRIALRTIGAQTYTHVIVTIDRHQRGARKPARHDMMMMSFIVLAEPKNSLTPYTLWVLSTRE